MSLNELIYDVPKVWLNARVNALKVDNGITFGDSTDALDYSTSLVSAQIGGTFYAGGIQDTTLEYVKIGKSVTLKIKAFTISSFNQNASGTLLLTPNVPADCIPSETVKSVVPFVDNAGNNQLCIIFVRANGNIQIFNGLVQNWTSGANLVFADSLSFVYNL